MKILARLRSSIDGTSRILTHRPDGWYLAESETDASWWYCHHTWPLVAVLDSLRQRSWALLPGGDAR